MSNVVVPAKCLVEIYSKTKVFADHFLKGWTAYPVGGVSSQADVSVLTVQSGQTEQVLYTTFDSFSTATYPYLVFRITAISGASYRVYVQRSDTSNWVQVASGSSTGRHEVTLTTYYSGNIKALSIYAVGSAGQSVTYDYVIVCGEYYFPDAEDITGTLKVTKSLINDEVNEASVTLKQFSGDSYLDIDDRGCGIIWVSRNSSTLGTVDQKLFGGVIKDVKQNFLNYVDTDVTITFYGHASELFAPPELVYQLYDGVNGRTIMEEAIDLCSYIAKYPHGIGWFDEGGSQIGDTDDQIASTHNVEYDEVKPLSVVQEILEKASNPAGTIGFDMYETPSGALVGHLRNSLDFICPVTADLRSAVRRIDVDRIRNAQKVYGATGKQVPTDEIWTESTSGWTTDTGLLLAKTSQGAYTPKEGTYFLFCQYDGNDAVFRRSIASTFYYFGKKRATNLTFWRLRYGTSVVGATVGRVELWAPDASNCFYYGLDLTAGGYEWRKYDLPLGADGVATDEDDNKANKWQTIGSPAWNNVQQICFRVTDDITRSGLGIDNLRFTGIPYSNSDSPYEDARSILDYTRREAEPIVDNTLMSDAECVARAKSVVEQLKSPNTTVEPFIVDGDARYLPSYLMTDGVNYFKIVKVEDTLTQGGDWTATIHTKKVD
jgi:hypothetical protein